MPEILFSTEFWIAVVQIIMIDIVLSGDNAVVIALACRNLSPEMRRKGILWGGGGHIPARCFDHDGGTGHESALVEAHWRSLADLDRSQVAVARRRRWARHFAFLPPLGAIRTIIVADFVMSLDNVIAVAGASHGNLSLLVFGLLVSIPLIIWSSQMILHLMERWPVVVMLGAGLLGWVAGAMIWSDRGLADLVVQLPSWMQLVVPALTTMLVIASGQWAMHRQKRGKQRVIE